MRPGRGVGKALPDARNKLSSKIEDYGLIGDSETAALVGRDGSINWLCWPAFDSDACFAALLGTRQNGRWKIAPAGALVKSSRRYRGDTLILETRFDTAEGTVTLVDFMPPRGKASDIVRPPTASLPAKLGGARNWDYRFCWLRDATFTLLALMNSGYTDEALAWHNWLLRSVAGSPADMQIMYGISGQRRLLEWEATWLPGYGGARPVRVGNAAHAQLQLDVYGELIDAFHQWRMAKLELGQGTWALERAVLDHLAEVWDHPDHGIWERRGESRHYVSSKVMTWVAFDRGIKSAERFGLEGPVDQWKTLRDTICRDVCDKGFDREQNAFVESYGSKLLDASILLLPSVGFLPASDPRVKGTLAAIEGCMMRDGFVLRHDPREAPEEQPAEGAFLACSLWLADAYALGGDFDKAQALFDRVVGVANDVGLLAEEYDPDARRQTGNFPQALTHIALINTAHNLSAARKPAEKPAVQRTQ